ncbi:hypothetical protein CC86DRAFT_365982 [Ophiobolus disseminans]|uniref:Uncharacterized protein n=1 Tax=Ophiobolus disseminans TaxID=1469910 RepID=A0A6A7AGN8_9PLEO|nr:hypothetical protein CC86DRAFT_365982 [Ophiobolus disseminans]
MQNYGQQPGYQRPGSAASFAGQQTAPPVPPYGGGYQSAAPQNQSQWAPPPQNQPSNQQWNQPQQQAAGGYNPGTYGVMGGGNQPPPAYPPQQHDQPPPPPPKPYGFASAPQQPQNQWSQPPQQNFSHAPQQQGGYPTQGGAQSQQQPYNVAAPPPPSATPGGSYFPPAQGGRPGSIYGAQQVGSYSNTLAAGPQQTSTVMSPNEQQPAYIPPSLTGQGVQAYMPSNTNPMPGVYVPPPPDVPAWQQAQHAPLQGGLKKFRYTKPTVDPSFYVQGYQGVQPMQPQQPQPPPGQYAQSPVVSQHPQQPFGPPPPHQYVPHGNMPQQPPPPTHDQFTPQQPQQAPYAQQPQFGQPMQQPGQYQQQASNQPPFDPNTQGQQVQGGQYAQQQGVYGASNVSKPHNDYPQASNMSKPHDPFGNQGASNISKPYNDYQWQAPAPAGQTHGGQDQQNPQIPSESRPPQWQPGHNQAPGSHGSLAGQQYVTAPGQDIEAPKPLSRTDTASSNFFNQPSPQSQPVSPVNNRQSMSFGFSGQTGVGRTGSVSSIALANLHAQREGNRTSSPKPPPPKLPTPPPPRDHQSKFSALGSGGPSDWEHFGDSEVDDEDIYAKKPMPAEIDSVELPGSQPELAAGPSPPSTHGWPSPASQPTPLTSSRSDTYQPTPPPVIAHLAGRPPSQPPQQGFIMGDAAPPPPSISPKPVHGAFEMGDAAWTPPRQRTPKQGTPNQHQSQYQPPPAQQGFVMDDGNWAAQPASAQSRQQTPSQLPQHQPPVITGSSMGDITRGASQRTPTQETSAWKPQQTQQHAAELKAKEEALAHLRLEAEKEKANLHAQIKKLEAEFDQAKAQALDEQTMLQEQIEAMKTAANEAKTGVDAATKEKNLTIERMKEDVEGKEHNIEERDATIAELRRQLEEEKAKEPVKVTPTPGDLIPDLNPWYAGSLERYIAMLRGEAHEAEVEDKIKIFRAFLKAESEVRGIPFYEAPLAAPASESVTPVFAPGASNMSKPVPAPGASNMSKPFAPIGELPQRQHGSHQSNPSLGRRDLSVQVPATRADSPDEEGCDYSPGGRPLLKRKATMPSNDNFPTHQHFGSSTQSTTILTPTSSVDDDSNKTPVQLLPEEQPVYKAYVPPALFSADPTPSSHGRSMSEVSIPAPLTSNISRPTMPSIPSQHHDEIFFGASNQSKPPSRPTSSDSATPKVPVPAPLAFSSSRPVSTAPPSKKDPAETLARLLPSEIAPVTSNHDIEKVRAKLAPLKEVTSNPDDLIKEWEKTAAVTRKKLDQARRTRQEENEEDNNEAFDNNEISYAALNELEDEFKQREAGLKTQEDIDEYKSYVEAVFDNVYDALQSDIKGLMDLYIEAENLLHTSVSGVKSLEPTNDAPSTQASLELVQDVHDLILNRQEAVVAAVAERDKRYKKTQIAPLYVSGNITKMKTVEKHFESAEKQALIRALRDKASKIGELVNAAEDVIFQTVGVESKEIDAIVAAMQSLDDASTDPDLLARAQSTLTHLKSSSTALFKHFTALEIRHNAAVLDAEIAQAKAENADTSRIKELEEEKAKGENKFTEEFKRREEVIGQDADEIAELVTGKASKGAEEVEREKRLKAALEEAKRRNGHA